MSKIRTCRGVLFDFNEPEKHDFHVLEIAHALSHLCRYTGHTRQFYSVAQHSVYVSYAVPPRWALAGLLHDGSEAYLGDVASPLKALLPDYRAIEARVEAAIAAQFPNAVGLYPLEPLIKVEDKGMLEFERWLLDDSITPTFVPWTPEEAERAFINRYYELACV